MSRTKLQAIEYELQSRYLDRDEEIHGLVLATLSRCHVELLGPPGNAKSMLVRDFTEYITEAHIFSWLMTKFTTPDEIFGPIDIQSMKAGVYRRITTNKLPEAHIGYLDEIYKASSPILNSLLSILQEHIYYNDGTVMQCPLIFCVGTSNELPDEDEGLSALHDRFPLRYNPGYIEDSNTFKALLTLQHGAKTVAPISRQELDDDTATIRELVLTNEAIESIALVWERLREENIVVSDRRYKQMVTVMAAESWMMGASEIVSDSLVVGEHILWDKPTDIRTVKQVVRSCINPSLAKAQEIQAAAQEVMAELAATSHDSAEILNVVKQLDFFVKDLDSLSSSTQVSAVREQLDKQKNELINKMISSSNGGG